MTEAKRKAEELYAKFLELTANDSIDNPISVMKRPFEMALICVEEIMKSYPFGYSLDDKNHWQGSSSFAFWQEVRDELNKMK